MSRTYDSDLIQAAFDSIRVLQSQAVFPLSVMPHLALLLTGKKQVARFVLDSDVISKLCHSLASHGFASVRNPVAVQPHGNDWSQFEPTEASTSSSAHEMVVLGRDLSLVRRVADLELNGEGWEVGRLLEYPDCCIEGYHELSQATSGWPEVMMQRSDDPFRINAWCNRFASLWGGVCPTGELFPCSLNCNKAVELGKDGDAALRELGLDGIADEILRQSKIDIYWYNGEVVCGEPLDSVVQKFTIRD